MGEQRLGTGRSGLSRKSVLPGALHRSSREVHIAGFTRHRGAFPGEPCVHSRRKGGFSHKAVGALQAI
jgi:hypothetical protein